MPIDISDKEQLDVPLTGQKMSDALVKVNALGSAEIATQADLDALALTTEQSEALVAAHNSKTAIENIEGMSATGGEIDNSVYVNKNARILQSVLRNAKKIANVGDSKSQNTRNADPINKSWFHLIRRAIFKDMCSTNVDNYGFESISSAYYYQKVTSSGTWTTGDLFEGSYTGHGYWSNTIGDPLDFRIWTTVYKKFQLGYLSDTSDSSFTISINGTVVDTINVIGTATEQQYFTPLYDIPEWSIGIDQARVTITVTSGKVILSGSRQWNDENEITFDNCSLSGRRTLNMNTQVIQQLCEDYDVIIWSLGENDDSLTDTDQTIVLARLDDLKTYALANNTIVIFNDLIFGADDTNYYRSRIMELSTELPNSLYIEHPNLILADGSISTVEDRDAIGLTTDGTHLSDDYGNFWIASTIANRIGIKVSKDYIFDTDVVLDSTTNSPTERLPRDWGLFNGANPFIDKVSGFAVNNDIYIDTSTTPPIKKYFNKSTGNWTAI